jgi:DNA-binding NarL/FixJ family response regulator
MSWPADASPDIAIAVIDDHDAIHAGMQTWCAEARPPARLVGSYPAVNAIRAAASDTSYIGPRMASAMSNDTRFGRPSLTPRESEVLVAWFQTESKDLVAQRLFVSPSTVRTFLQRVRAK